jgi:cyclic pyranopterin phosphate synthase
MPSGGIPLSNPESILSFEEILEVVKAAVKMGVRKVRISGGEPLVRRDIPELVRMVASVGGVEDLAMSTNGVLLARFARSLAEAGLHRVNISLDTLDPQRYRDITRLGRLADVLEGIEEAERVGLRPIKLNCVVSKSSDEPDAVAVRRFAASRGLQVRFIRRMNLARGQFWPIEGGEGGNCRGCNRLRLSSDGFIRPCLFDDIAFSTRELGSETALRRAVENKPESGTSSRSNQFFSVGG